MVKAPAGGVGDRVVLGAAFRRIRRRRRLRSAEVAQAMGLPLRSYQHLESGAGCFLVAHLQAFARATDSDPLALLLAGVLRSAEFADRCADVKLATLAVMFVEDMHQTLGEDLARLNAATVLSALGDVLHDLRRQARIASAGAPATGPRIENLTQRQLECLSWVREGKSSADIGGILGLSPRTVDDHIGKACHWFGVRTRGQAVQAALRLGLLQAYP